MHFLQAYLEEIDSLINYGSDFVEPCWAAVNGMSCLVLGSGVLAEGYHLEK